MKFVCEGGIDSLFKQKSLQVLTYRDKIILAESEGFEPPDL